MNMVSHQILIVKKTHVFLIGPNVLTTLTDHSFDDEHTKLSSLKNIFVSAPVGEQREPGQELS